jgi:VWFA-related protein
MRRIGLIAAIVLGPLALCAQNQQSSSGTIRVSTRLVQINVLVHDKHGAVANLTKEDFVVSDRGKVQPISVFSVASAASTAEHTQLSAASHAELPAGEFSNLAVHGGPRPRSITILLLDNLNTLTGPGAEPYEAWPMWLEDHALANAKNHLLEYLKGLEPGDRVAIYSLSDGLHVLCDFTSDRAQLLGVVEKFDATSKTRRETVDPQTVHTPVPGRGFNASIDRERQTLAGVKNEERSRITMDALRTIVTHVADIPGRKNLVWLTANLPFSGTAIARILAPAEIAAYPVDARGLLPRSENVQAMMNVVDADDLARARDNRTGSSFQPIGIETMQKMADETGGRAFTNTNDLTNAIREAIDDGEITYTLGFYVSADALDDKLHELKVRVTHRPDANVRYPRAYFASKADPKLESENRTRLVAIQSPLESSTIAVRAKLQRSGAPEPNSLEVAATVDIHEVQFANEGGVLKGSFDIYCLQQDVTGKVIEGLDNRINLNLTNQQYQAELNSGAAWNKVIALRPEAKTLRVLVQDRATSKIGSLIVPVAEIK